MAKYRTRILEIEAIQWTSDVSIKEIDEFMGGTLKVDSEGGYYIETLEGNMYLSLGCYIVKGTHGEFYPVKPEVFEYKYEKVEG